MADLAIDDTIDVNISNDDGSKKNTLTTIGSKEAVDVNIAGDDGTPVNGLYICKHLQNGGSNDLAVNGSVTPVVFSRGPATGKRWYISRLILTIQDNGMNYQKFGGLAKLTNGVDVDYDSGGVNLDLLDGTTWKANNELIHFCYDADILTGTIDVLRMRWTFSKGGTFLDLNNTDGDTFNLTVNDNLTNLSDMFAIVQGYEIDE